ncbi:MAG: hypothetical protein QOF49_1808 [Chloroflexota bacterium]|jgi:hypothetical protein|nr:hypothetical protein [Chloroflexota bacterium]
MKHSGPGGSALTAVVLAVVLVIAGLVPGVMTGARAAGPDRSDVVLVLDFSASILNDAANRNRFGAALERIADRVDATSADLVAGDTTVSIVQFAAKAADDKGCADLKLLGSADAVGRFADCLRAVAAAYRKGRTAALTTRLGIDTNYVAAMEQAARHLPADAVRPAMILFTDGKHDVAGVPVGEVQPARDRLFGARTPFALLPVGMGLDPAERDALASGLEALRVIRDMPACVSGATFDWPQVVFETADQAGSAVATALQDATCTFTAEPSAPPTPSPTPAPTPAAVRSIRLTPGDGRIDLAWSARAESPVKVTDYAARCRAGEGDWIESTEGVSLETKATVEGLANGTAYRCEVSAVGASGSSAWAASAASVTPVGRPAPPAKPAVEALDGAVSIVVPSDEPSGVATYRYECSPDQGTTWLGRTSTKPGSGTALISGLTNGVDHVCRAFAENPTGVSDASPLSDAIKPCSGLFQCNPIVVPILGGLVLLLIAGLAAALIALYRGRTHGYVVAVVDVVFTANIGHGSNLGIAFVRAPDSRRVTDIVAERGPDAELRIQRLRGDRFAVRDRGGRRIATDGEPIVVTDAKGVRHSLTLRAFATNAASSVASRR